MIKSMCLIAVQGQTPLFQKDRPLTSHTRKHSVLWAVISRAQLALLPASSEHLQGPSYTSNTRETPIDLAISLLFICEKTTYLRTVIACTVCCWDVNRAQNRHCTWALHTGLGIKSKCAQTWQTPFFTLGIWCSPANTPYCPLCFDGGSFSLFSWQPNAPLQSLKAPGPSPSCTSHSREATLMCVSLSCFI